MRLLAFILLLIGLSLALLVLVRLTRKQPVSASDRSSALASQPATRQRFTMAEGCLVPDLTGIEEGFSVKQAEGYWVFTVNVSAERIPAVFVTLTDRIDPLVFFTIETGTHSDVEATLRRSDTDPFHKDVYYLDGLSVADAQEIYRKNERLFTHDGRVNFGIGSHEKHDEVMVGPYKVIYIYAVEPEKYREALEAMGFREVPTLRTVWDNIRPDAPGRRGLLEGEEESLWNLIDDLRRRGLRLAERRED